MSGSHITGLHQDGASPGRADQAPRPVPPVALAAPAATPTAPLAGPCLEDFVTGAAEHRLRDLLAFALAVEAARPTEREALRGKAEAELQAHAFRTLHNQVEAIRLEAARDQLARLRGGPGFLKLVLANLVALGLLGGIALALWLRPDLLPGGVF
ncbi:hypothetical protein [Falsiroseomonas tokyonensis]|uniref:Uncharacterized protein n=1 Tax=Falsiroseomonas tokyonensis TaxID=430521 RepID=A0ABV7BU31_9PROT|nr:hypothetical protein [Falsiroseomonas tokyonensis]MBU8537953.1 hypothetical protein [Falsiroseomonas tokyonensis]